MLMPSSFHSEHESKLEALQDKFTLSGLRSFLLIVKEKSDDPVGILLLSTEALQLSGFPFILLEKRA